MRTSVIALFGAQTDAETARAQLLELGIEEHRAYLETSSNNDDGFRLRVQLPDDDTEAVESVLRSANALDLVKVEEDWPPNKRYGLNYDHNISLGVAPGRGDSEAGS